MEGSLTPVPSPDDRLSALGDYNTRLTERVNFLGLRTQSSCGAVSPTLSLAMEELIAATEELRAADEELQAQAVALTDAQSQVEESRRHFQELFDFAPDAYLVTDPAGVIQEANQATSALVGYARTYVLGKPLSALLDPGATAMFATKLTALRQSTDERPQTWELTLRPRRTGSPVVTSARVAPIRTGDGTLTGFRWLLRDMTEQRATAAALVEMQATQAQQLRTRTMELEAVLRIHEESRTLDQAALHTLVRDTIQSLQHGAEPGALLAHVLATIQVQLDGRPLPADETELRTPVN